MESSETHSGEFIAGHMNHHQHHAFQFWLQTNSTVQFGVPTADQPQASLVDLKKSFFFLALEVILFISHCLIPSTLWVRLNAKYLITLWSPPSQAHWVYNISTSPTRYKKHPFLRESVWFCWSGVSGKGRAKPSVITLKNMEMMANCSVKSVS